MQGGNLIKSQQLLSKGDSIAQQEENDFYVFNLN